jgi:hypothetical protein
VPGYEVSWNCYDRLITPRDEERSPAACRITTATSSRANSPTT